MGLHLADYVVNETGFAADLGAEKFFDLVMPMCGHVPSVAVVIVTLKALRAQGGRQTAGPVDAGFPNLQRHLENLKRWGVPAVVALNRFPGDTDDDLERVRAFCATLGVEAALSEGYARGGDGMVELADEVVAAAAASDPEAVRPLYDRRPDARGEDHGDRDEGVRRRQGVSSSQPRARGCSSSRRSATARCPCASRRRSISFTDDPKLMGAPSGWTLNITDATLSAGAGFVVAIAGSMMLMPGLGKTPQAQKLDVDDTGTSSGMDY